MPENSPAQQTGLTDSFLAEFTPVSWTRDIDLPTGFHKINLFAQPIPNGLEVAVVRTSKVPTRAEMGQIWKQRKDGRPTPVLVVAGESGKSQVSICGLDSSTPFTQKNINIASVQKVVATALRKANQHTAIRYLRDKLPLLASEIPGLHNQGFFAMQELRYGVQKRTDWDTAKEKAAKLINKRGEDLLLALNFGIEQKQDRVLILTAGERQTAVAVALKDDEPYDIRASQHSLFRDSPISLATSVAERNNLEWMILTRGSEIRLYSSNANRGVGSGAREEKYLQLDLDLLTDEFAAYLYLLYSAEAMTEGGSLEQTLNNSKQFAAELAARLRDRVYNETVPYLAKAIARRIADQPTEQDLSRAYEQVMHILFRLLFVAYGEARELLPVQTNQQYADHSLTRRSERILEARRGDKPPWGENNTDLWTNVTQLWEAINTGNEGWGVPPYNGGLFSTDPDVSQPGAAIANMSPLANSEFGPALEALLIDKSLEGGYGPVDFRSLSVREFGTLYEGLLESSFSLARTDLTLNKKSLYVPAKPEDNVAVADGEVYFHNRSGARKSTGTYFTKAFAVEHLIDNALVPALDKHLESLDALRESDGEEAVAEAFFDFRCADLAMGSGHFLVAATDKIVEKMSKYLEEHPIQAVNNELRKLREASDKAVAITATADTESYQGADVDTSVHTSNGDGTPTASTQDSTTASTETTPPSSDVIPFESLLRRQVAMRCIYGVDINQVAVELAQVALWIHTFIPGLPLSFLGRNLVCGDSLTGVASLEEVISELEPGHKLGQPSLYRSQIESRLERATDALRRLATNSEKSISEVEDARKAAKEMEHEIAPAKALFDLVSAKRGGVDVTKSLNGYDEEAVIAFREKDEVEEVIDRIRPLHFPATFPEVFLRERPGFDCLLGNPPWEKVKVDSHAWWCQHLPGIKGLPVGAMNQAIAEFEAKRPDLAQQYADAVDEKKIYSSILRQGVFDLGGGDTDLYQIFAWRFWHLARSAGFIGIVLPRPALQGKGSTPWRKAIVQDGIFSDVTVLVNNAAWVFDDVHHSYSVACCSIEKVSPNGGFVHLSGPHYNFESYNSRKHVKIPLQEFKSWSTTAAFPNIPSDEALSVFEKLRLHPRIDEFSKNIILSSAQLKTPIILYHVQSQNCMGRTTNIGFSSSNQRARCYQREILVLRNDGPKSVACIRGEVL